MEVVPALDVLKYGHPGFGLCAVVWGFIDGALPLLSGAMGLSLLRGDR